MSKDNLLRSYVASKKDVQIKFKDDPGPPVGPGKLEIVSIELDEQAGIMNHTYYFKITAPAMLAGPGGRPQQVLLPIIFDADDVLWLTEGPVNVEGDKLITELPGRKTPGGLHLG